MNEDPVEQRKAESPPAKEDVESRTRENDGKPLKPRRNCLNCMHLGEDWTCRAEGRREIGNPFEERADCGDWKPVEATLGLIQVFPPCTPEYDAVVQETVERALADYSGQEGRDDSVQKGRTRRQKE